MEVMIVTSTIITLIFLIIYYADMKYIKKENFSKDSIKSSILVYVSSFAGLFIINKFNLMKLKKKPQETQVFVDKPEF